MTVTCPARRLQWPMGDARIHGGTTPANGPPRASRTSARPTGSMAVGQRRRSVGGNRGWPYGGRYGGCRRWRGLWNRYRILWLMVVNQRREKETSMSAPPSHNRHKIGPSLTAACSQNRTSASHLLNIWCDVVADTVNWGENLRVAGVILHFLAELAHHDVDRSVVGRPIPAADHIQ